MDVTNILELQNASGVKEKQLIIHRNSEDKQFCDFLYYALNPLITYNLSEKTLRENNNDKTPVVLFEDIFECCDILSRLKGIDDSTVRQVKSFLYNKCNEQERELYIKLLSKTLRLGVTAKTVNKVIPNLIPEWEVQQAFPIDKYPLKDGTEFWLTQKLNGVRATFYNGKLISRSGTPFEGLEHILNEIRFVNVAGFVLDGELTLKDKGSLSDNEAFREATGIINSDSVNKTTICYTVFDIIPIKDFETNNPTVSYSVRRTIIDELTKSLTEAEYTKVLPVLYHGTDQNQINVLLEQMVKEDKEGLMLNTDVPYKRSRHRGILKIKRFYTMDLPIIRCEEGNGRLEGTLGAFVLNYKDNEVRVGSGFTDEQRQAFWSQADNLLGVLCEVKYKEISSDKSTGQESLQFPVFMGLREDKMEVSYG